MWFLADVEGHYIIVNYPPCSGEPKYEIFDSISPASSNMWLLAFVEGHYIIVKFPLCSGFEELPLYRVLASPEQIFLKKNLKEP